MAASGFWADQAKANKLMQELKFLKAGLQLYKSYRQIYNDIKELSEIVESDDERSLNQLEKDIASLEGQISQAEFNSMLGEPEDRSDAILSINAGAGGTESCDW